MATTEGTGDDPTGDGAAGAAAGGPIARLPFPDSLCHRCAAPPQYVRTRRSVFILCPLLPNRYPPQPVLVCPWFRPRP